MWANAVLTSSRTVTELCGVQVHSRLMQDVEDARQHVNIGFRRDIHFDIDDVVKATCSSQNRAYAHFSTEMREFCEQILLVNADAIEIFARHFSGSMPSAANVFTRKGKICGDLKRECRTLELSANGVSHIASKAKKISKCQLCQTFVADVWSTLRRWSRDSDYFLSVSHVESVMEDACSMAQHFHPTPFSRAVEGMCENLMADYDSELLSTFVRFKSEFTSASTLTVDQSLEVLIQRVCDGTASLCSEQSSRSRGEL